MSTIGTTASYASDIAALLLSGSADTQPPATKSASGADAGSDPTRNPATRVDLSDKIKEIGRAHV